MVEFVQHILPVFALVGQWSKMLPAVFTRHAANWFAIQIEEFFMFLQNRAVWDIDLTRDGFSFEAFVCDVVHIRTSYAKAGREAEGTVRAEAGAVAPATVHKNENCV